MSFSSIINIKNIIKTHKDEIEKMCNCGTVYKISCIDCTATYVGQTKRKLRKRIDEHRADVRRNSTISVINSHKTYNNHTIN